MGRSSLDKEPFKLFQPFHRHLVLVQYVKIVSAKQFKADQPQADSGGHRSASFIMGIGPFQWFQPFNRFATFKPLKAGSGSIVQRVVLNWKLAEDV